MRHSSSSSFQNIFFQRFGIGLDPLFGHRVSNICNNVMMYVLLYIPSLIKVRGAHIVQSIHSILDQFISQ